VEKKYPNIFNIFFNNKINFNQKPTQLINLQTLKESFTSRVSSELFLYTPINLKNLKII